MVLAVFSNLKDSMILCFEFLSVIAYILKMEMKTWQNPTQFNKKKSSKIMKLYKRKKSNMTLQLETLCPEGK